MEDLWGEGRGRNSAQQMDDRMDCCWSAISRLDAVRLKRALGFSCIGGAS